MKKEIQAILFDLDGTVIDSADFIRLSFQITLEKHGLQFPLLWEEFMAKCCGLALPEAYKALTGQSDVENLCKTHRLYQRENEHTVRPFVNVWNTLIILEASRIKMAIVTNRADSVHQTLDRTGLTEFFLTVRHTNNTPQQRPKPHPQMLLDALEYMDVDSSHALMVGDMREDIMAGKAAYVTTVGTTYGFTGKRIEDHNPDYIIHDIRELLKILFPNT